MIPSPGGRRYIGPAERMGPSFDPEGLKMPVGDLWNPVAAAPVRPYNMMQVLRMAPPAGWPPWRSGPLPPYPWPQRQRFQPPPLRFF